MKRLAIITTHPIQYNAPWFSMLAKRQKVKLKVFYTWPQAIDGFDDPDFKTKISWDIPLLDNYEYTLIKNTSTNPSSKSWNGIVNPTLISEVSNFCPDIVLVFGWKLRSHFLLMKHFRNKIPIWFRGDSTLLDEIGGLKDILRRNLLKFIYKYIDKALYVGTNNKAYFKKHGLIEKQLLYVPHAIDNARFLDDSEHKYESKAKNMRKELGINEANTTILFSGKLESKKNPLFLLKAINEINKSKIKSKINLIFVGSGPLEHELKSSTQGDVNIHFLPFQNQSMMPIIYRLSDIFCLPSQGPQETWGLAINEALACGKPVLVSNKAGCAIDLVNNNVGRIFNSNDIENLKSKIIDLIRIKIDEKTCQQHISNWSFETICNNIENEVINNIYSNT